MKPAQFEAQEPVAWKLVPIKPTDEMLKAMDECSTEGYDERLYAGHAASVYMAAVDVAPTPPQQEPVAWGVFEGNLHDMFFSPSEAQEMADLKGTHAEVRPLYITPPQRTWVGLTAKEKHEFRYSHMTTADFIEDIEAKLKEKNI